MNPISDSQGRQEYPETQLENEIADIRAQIKSLTQRRATLTSTLLSTISSQSLLKRVKYAPLPDETSTTSSIYPGNESPLLSAALAQSKKHTKHSQECLYRMCAGATMFKIKDPDPNATDDGRVYGVRIEVFSGNEFLSPYYLILNRPYPNSLALRLHRHTIPPCIDLSALRTKYLPTPINNSQKPKKQNLPRLVRELRRELVSYHLRLASVESLRAAICLNNTNQRSGNGIKDISLADAEGRNIRINWTNGNLGHVRIAKDGRIEQCVVMGEHGRERGIERTLMCGDGHMLGLAKTLLDFDSV
ncbi:MAG: hypothetical protein M1836_007904 [Candelina mexicana]|nr:MAG: hypothetical protein M1836_007904 [Candelina mexicana]